MSIVHKARVKSWCEYADLELIELFIFLSLMRGGKSPTWTVRDCGVECDLERLLQAVNKSGQVVCKGPEQVAVDVSKDFLTRSRLLTSRQRSVHAQYLYGALLA